MRIVNSGIHCSGVPSGHENYDTSQDTIESQLHTFLRVLTPFLRHTRICKPLCTYISNRASNILLSNTPKAWGVGTNSFKFQIQGPIYLKRWHSKISSNLGPNILKKIIEKYIYWALILAGSKNKYIGPHFWSLLGGPALILCPNAVRKISHVEPM